MRISLTHGYMSPPDFRPKNEIKQKDIDNRIENKLKKLGWRVDCNRAAIECNTVMQIAKILSQLIDIGITGGIHIDGLNHKEVRHD